MVAGYLIDDDVGEEEEEDDDTEEGGDGDVETGDADVETNDADIEDAAADDVESEDVEEESYLNWDSNRLFLKEPSIVHALISAGMHFRNSVSNTDSSGTSVVVQWLRLQASNAGGGAQI